MSENRLPMNSGRSLMLAKSIGVQWFYKMKHAPIWVYLWWLWWLLVLGGWYLMVIDGYWVMIGWWLGGHCEVIGWLLISGSWGLLMVIGCQCHPTFEFRNHWDVMGKKRTPRIQSQPKGGKPKLVGSIPFDSFGSQLWISILDLNFLVAGFNLPLWKFMSSSVGMMKYMKFPTEWKVIKFMIIHVQKTSKPARVQPIPPHTRFPNGDVGFCRRGCTDWGDHTWKFYVEIIEHLWGDATDASWYEWNHPVS